MNKILREKIMEAFSSVLPITLIVLVSSVVLTPLPSGTVLLFLAGAALLIIGMGFFSLGTEMAMITMGEGIGVQLTKSSKLALIIIVSFVMGVIITVAEPNLMVLAQQVPAIPFWHFISTVAIGVGTLMVIAVLKTLFKIRLSVLLIVSYGVVFGMSYFSPSLFIPIAFESGAIATGPILVPFIMSIGLGLASVRSDKASLDDSFGLLALVLIGPIIAMFLLGIFYNPQMMSVETAVIQDAATSRDVVTFFAIELPHFFIEVSIALAAVVFCFIVFQLVSRRYRRHQLGRIAIGFLYVIIGLVLFLTGVSVGFFPVGELLGIQLAESPFRWVLIPLGTLIGYYIVMAEPAVHVLTKQVEEISSGAISRKMLNRGLAIGMAVAIGITMIRILLGVSLMWILVPGYIIALVLTFCVPKIFTAIAFDAGTVCSGPMSAAFLLPFAMGICDGIGRDVMTYAIGIVAIIAMTPLVVIQILGFMYQLKINKASALSEQYEVQNIDWGAVTEFSEES